jgi:hypothetical protein
MSEEAASMENFHNIISQLSLSSLCERIKHCEEQHCTAFRLKHSFHDSDFAEDFYLSVIRGELFISDMGCTFANVNEVIELELPDTVKDIKKILKRYEILQESLTLFKRLDQKKEVMPQIFRFLQGIHFIYTLKLFYYGEDER